MPSLCYFSAEGQSIIDTIDASGLTSVYRHTADQVRERHPDAEVIEYAEAFARVEQAAVSSAPARISAEQFEEISSTMAFERWNSTPGFEYYELSERVISSVAVFIVRDQGVHWLLNDYPRSRSSRLQARIQGAKEQEPCVQEVAQ